MAHNPSTEIPTMGTPTLFYKHLGALHTTQGSERYLMQGHTPNHRAGGIFAVAGIPPCPHTWKRISKHLTEPAESGAPPAPGPGCLPRLLGSLPDSSQDLLYKQEQWQFGKASRGGHGGGTGLAPSRRLSCLKLIWRKLFGVAQE